MANTGFSSPIISTWTSKPSPTPSLAPFPPHHHLRPLRFSGSFLEELVRRTPQATPSPDGFGTITITSEPDAAEIFLDGKFHGHTPATLKLPAGSHTVLLQSPGYSDYSRTFELPQIEQAYSEGCISN